MPRKAPYLVPWIVLCSLSMASGELPTVTFQLVPVSADEKPRFDLSLAEWRIEGNEIFLDRGGRPVWLEIWMSDWDPNEDEIRIKSFRATIDSTGYASGQGGILVPYQFACLSDRDCAKLLGENSACETGSLTNYCDNGFIRNRSGAEFEIQYLFAHTLENSWIKSASSVDRATPDFVYEAIAVKGSIWNYACWSSIDEGHPCSPEVCPNPNVDCYEQCCCVSIDFLSGPCLIDHSERYLGTLVLWVPPDAEGTFTINLKPYPDTALIDEFDQPFPLELVPAKAKVTVSGGACCYKVDTPSPGCIDGVTLAECEALAGTTVYNLGETCAEDLCSGLADVACCLADHSCAILPRQDCLAQNGRETLACAGDDDGNGRDDGCDPDRVPATSHWGVIITILSLATLARLRFRRAVRLQTL